MSLRAWTAYTIVFVASACTLVLEIVAGRILAPFIGVSLYTWTTIIGVVLAGISLGNYAGGVLADRKASSITLGVVLLLGGLFSLAVLPLVEVATSLASDSGFSLVAKIVVMTSLIFFPPSFILGMVSPLVIKLTLQSLAQTGGVVGKIYAFSTLGSIVGTFATGFWLISTLGTRMIVLLVGLVILGIALLLLLADLLARKQVATAGVTTALVAAGTAGFVYLASSQGALSSGCLKETDYFCIKVIDDETYPDRQVRQLVLDHLIHSYNDLKDPTFLKYGYIKVYAEVTDYIAQENPRFRALHIGGGGYTIPRFVEHVYPGASEEVIEIDPAVTETAFEEMGVARDTRIRTYNEDGRLRVQYMVSNGVAGSYHLIFGDAFNDLSIPYHLTTREFAQKIKTLLRPDGFYLANVIDKVQGGLFLSSYFHTLRTVFDHVYVLADGPYWDGARPNTYVVAAGQTPLNQERLSQVRGQGAAGRPVTLVMPPEKVEQWMADGYKVLLTDEYAPADNLVAPLFLERGY